MATFSRPLTALTRKNKATGRPVKLKWSQECESTFNQIKSRLVSAPVLHPPDMDKPFIVWTYASKQGFGAVFKQKAEDGERHPVAYASRCTNQAEQKYGVSKLEVAALVYALEHFQVYLLGSKVTVYPDHQALVSSFVPYFKSQMKGILARWYLRLSQYLPNVTLEHKPGSVNREADTLS